MKVMKWSVIAMAVAAGTSQMAIANEQSQAQGFVEDAKLDLLLRTTYFNRDFKDPETNPRHQDVRSLGQGFITTFESGFTQGTVGFGVNAFGLLGVRLDGGSGYNYDNMFEFDNGEPERDVGQAGAAVKARISSTTLAYGDQMPAMPVLAYDNSRLLPETFTGTLITSNEIEGLQLSAGRFTAGSSMQGSSHDDLGLTQTDVLGGTYSFTDAFSASLYFSDVEDVYEKQYANLNYVMPLSDEQALSFDFNIYLTDFDNGSVAATDMGGDGNNDENTAWSLAAKYSTGAHAFILAHQRISGDAGYAYAYGDGGFSIYLANSYYSDFNSKDERSWQASYELDFSSYGAPGLFWKTAYVYGDNVDTGNGEGKEREFFNQVQYVVQQGPAKDLSLKLRNSIYRSNAAMRDAYSRDLNEIRAFIEYPLSIL